MKDQIIKGRSFQDIRKLKRIHIVNDGEQILIAIIAGELSMQVAVDKCNAKKIKKHLKKIIKLV